MKSKRHTPDQIIAKLREAAAGLRPLGLRKANPAGHVRPAGLHALLGPVAQGQLGGEAEDGQESLDAGPTDGGPLVPDQPTPTDHGATADAEPEAERALRVLRDHGQRFCVVHVPPRSDADLAEVAVPPPSSG